MVAEVPLSIVGQLVTEELPGFGEIFFHAEPGSLGPALWGVFVLSPFRLWSSEQVAVRLVPTHLPCVVTHSFSDLRPCLQSALL